MDGGFEGCSVVVVVRSGHHIVRRCRHALYSLPCCTTTAVATTTIRRAWWRYIVEAMSLCRPRVQFVVVRRVVCVLDTTKVRETYELSIVFRLIMEHLRVTFLSEVIHKVDR